MMKETKYDFYEVIKNWDEILRCIEEEVTKDTK